MADNVGRQIKLGALLSYAGLAINIIISLLYTPWMASTIGQSNYALYTLASSFISLFMVDFGLSSAASRFIAKYRAEGNVKQINIFVVTIEKLYAMIDIFIMVVLTILFFFVDDLYAGLTADEISTFKSLYMIVAIYSIVSFPCLPFSGILNAYEQFIKAKICDVFNKVFSVLIIVAALFLGAGVTAIVLAQAVSCLCTIFLKILFIYKSTPVRPVKAKLEIPYLKEIAGFSVWVTVMSIAQRCIFNLAPSILGIVSTSTDIAIFAPANALEGYFYSIASAVNGLFLATISRYIAKNEDEKILELMIKVGRYQIAVMGLIFIGFVCVGRDFMVAWMGIDYVKAWPCAVLMFIPDLLLVSQQIGHTTVIAKNRVKEQAIGYVIMAVICVVLSFILSPRFGVIGSAVSIAVSYLFQYIYMNILFKKLLGIDIFTFFRKCYGSFIIPLLLSGICSYYVSNERIILSGWKGIVIKAVSIGCIYFIFVIFALTKEEKVILKSYIVRKLLKLKA